MWSDLEGQWVCIRGIAKSQPWPNQFQKTRILFNRLYGIIIIPVGGSHDIATGSSPFFVDMPTIGPSTSELLPMLLYVPAACLSIALVHKQVPRWCSTAQDRHTYTAVLVHISLSSEGLTTKRILSSTLFVPTCKLSPWGSNLFRIQYGGYWSLDLHYCWFTDTGGDWWWLAVWS